MLNFLSSENKNRVIGFSLTPGIGLEAVVLDKSKSQVLNYGVKKVDYNFAQRSIQNYDQLKTAISELMTEMKIPAKSYAYLVLPNVCFNFIEITQDASDEGIEMALTSTAEEYYIFKKEEPVIGWTEVVNPEGGTQRKLAYCAFQKSTIDVIKEVFADLNLQLSGIESAYSATLRGLNLTGLINDAIMMQSSWSALLINTNSFTLFQMEGKNIINCSEVPLAIKSFSPEEAYQAIATSASQLLNQQATSQLYIISQTDDVSAQALKKIMQFDKEIIAIDTNKYSKQPLMDVVGAIDYNTINQITLSALGAADIKSSLGLTINILGNDPNASMGVYFKANILGKSVDVTTAYVQKTACTIAMGAFLIGGILYGGSAYFKMTQESELSDLRSEISRIDSQIREAQKYGQDENAIDMTMIIDEIAHDNVTAIDFYDSISTDIPKNIWLTKYYNKAGNFIAVRGIAESIIDIYEYYKNLRMVSPQSDIKLTELRVVTNPSGLKENDMSKYINTLTIDNNVDRLYSFEIANVAIGAIGNTKNAKNYDESDILARPTDPIEETSSQMSPTR